MSSFACLFLAFCLTSYWMIFTNKVATLKFGDEKMKTAMFVN